jgi:hypothetical protein
MTDFKVGDRVRVKEAIYEPADDHAPGGYVCLKGDLLIVREVREKGQWPLSVSHEEVTDNSFACGPHEIEPDSAQENPHD